MQHLLQVVQSLKMRLMSQSEYESRETLQAENDNLMKKLEEANLAYQILNDRLSSLEDVQDEIRQLKDSYLQMVRDKRNIEVLLQDKSTQLQDLQLQCGVRTGKFIGFNNFCSD